MATNKHVSAFSTKYLRPSETVRASAAGYIGELMGQGKKTQHNGALIVTSERVVFYRKGVFGEVLETIPLDKITSVERKSLLGHKVIRIHTSHDQLEFKTFEDWDLVLAALEEQTRSVQTPAPVLATSSGTAAERLKQLAALHQSGLITDEELAAKRQEILAEV